MSHDSGTMGDAVSDEYDYPDELERGRLEQVVVSRWKHAVVAGVVGATAWALYRIGEGWTLDATVFALAAVAVVAYSLLTLRTDLE